MRIDKLHIQDFGQFHGKDMTLAPGINVIYGPNESGKTTTKDFIVDMLYGVDNGEGALEQYEKRKPIYGEAYCGSMEVTTQEGQYLIERDFFRQNTNVTVKDLNTGEYVELQEKDTLEGTLLHTDKSLYTRTLCMGQTVTGMDSVITGRMNDYIMSMASGKAGDLDVGNVIAQLNHKKSEFSNDKLEEKEKELTAKLQLDRDYDGEIAALQEEYKKLEAAGGRKKEPKLQFTPIKNSSMREEAQESDSLEEDNELPEETMSQRERDMEMLRNMGNRSVLDNVFVMIFISLLLAAVFVGVAWLVPVNIPQLKMGIMGFGIVLVVLTLIQVLSRRAKLYRLLEELEIEQGFEAAKAEVATAGTNEHAEEAFLEIKKKEQHIQEEREQQEKMLLEITDIRQKMASNNVELAALDLAIRTIQDLSEEVYDSFGSVLNEQVSALVGKMTNHKYTEVRIDNQLRVLVKSGNSFIGTEYLSAATVEQIYLALRLAIANILVAEDLPIIMDDSFITYDYQSLYDTLSCLGEYKNRQIILLTKNPGIQDMFAQLGIEKQAISL